MIKKTLKPNADEAAVETGTLFSSTSVLLPGIIRVRLILCVVHTHLCGGDMMVQRTPCNSSQDRKKKRSQPLTFNPRAAQDGWQPWQIKFDLEHFVFLLDISVTCVGEETINIV